MNNRYVLIGLVIFAVLISGCIIETDSDGDGYSDKVDDFPKNENYHSDLDGDGYADEIDAFPSDVNYHSAEEKELDWQQGCYHFGPRDVWICDNYQATKEFVQSIPSDELIASGVGVIGIAYTTENYVLAYSIPYLGAQVPFFEIYEPSEDTTHDIGSKEDVEKLGITITSYEIVTRLSDLDGDGQIDEIDVSGAYYHPNEEKELDWQQGCYYYSPRDVWICDNYQATKEYIKNVPLDELRALEIDRIGIAHTTGNYVLVYVLPYLGEQVPFFVIYEPSEDSTHDLGYKEDIEKLGITTTSYEMIIRLSDLEDDGYANDMDASYSYVEEEVNVTSDFGDEDTTTYETEDGQEVEVTTGDEDGWCPVGTSWKTSNPTTGEEVSMVYTGTKEIDGISMCVMEYEATNPDDEVARVEYVFSEDGETFSWKSYYENGTVQSEMTMKDGKMTMIDENGQVNEYETNQ